MTDWKITFPIEKAEKRDEGLFITGLASGPEMDAQGERMAGDLIYRFAEQINSTGGLALSSRLVYRDAHAPDGVLRDLGWINKAWVNNDKRLAVEVKLDDENPAATYLFRQLEKGKQFGMSVAGKVLDFADEFMADVGAVVRTYTDVILTEISNTTRPAWTPSFGSVLAKALLDTVPGATLKGADITASADVTPLGENMTLEVTKAPERVEVEVTEAPNVPEAPAEAPQVENAPADSTTDQPESIPNAPDVEINTDEGKPVSPDTEKSDDTAKDMNDASSVAYTLSNVLSLIGYATSEDVTSLRDAANSLIAFVSSEVGQTAAKAMADAESPNPPVPAPTPDPTPILSDAEKADLLANFSNLAKAMKAAGLLADDTAAPTAPEANSKDEGENLITKADEETPVEETTPALPTYEDLARSYQELTAKVAELEAAPPTQLPPIVERAADSEIDDFRKSLEELPREARLRAAFAAHTGSK